MNTLDFLKKVWPDTGHYFIDTPNIGYDGFKHYHCETIGEAAAKAQYLNENGLQVYFACSSFANSFLEIADVKHPGKTKKVYRTQDNVKLVKAFWLDLDVGEGSDKKYPDQQSAVQALGNFLREAGLPKPILVNSGYGVHAYWPTTETLLPTRWKYTADKLKALSNGLGLLADPSRTCDTASVLRPPGTTNRKVKNGIQGERPVYVISDADPVDHNDFEKRIDAALKAHELVTPAIRGKLQNVNEGFGVPNDYPQAHAEVLVDKCMQIKLFRDKPNDLDEPTWYAGLQVIHFAKDGDDYVHKWSAGYKKYSETETEAKITQIASMGPTSCNTFEMRNPDGCKGCPFKGKVTSPIQLGIKVEDKPPEIVIQSTELGEIKIEIPPPPSPFRRTTAGLFLEQDGVPIRFYRYDMWPMGIIWDDADDFMTVAMKHHLPQEGWQDFTFPASTMSSQKDFETLLIGKGVIPDNMKFMRAYMSSYLQDLQNTVKMQRLYDSLGWKDDTSFVYGKRIFSVGGVYHAGLSRTVPETIVSGITKRGTLDNWIRAANWFTQPGLEAHLFSFCTGFGSPLLQITGFSGCMLSMLGETGAGKTLAARAALSIYGKFENLQSGAKDTMNARMERLNAMANLPVYFDELTNIEPRELSNLVYMLSQGRGREKLRSDSSTRPAAQWSAIAMGSTNQSLYTILSHGKDNSEAEMMRVLEITVPKPGQYEKDMSGIFDLLKENYGHAGEQYINYIVRNRDSIGTQIRTIEESLNKVTGFEGKERFWNSLCSCVLFGYVAAYSAGLIKPDDFNESFKRLFDWTCQTFVSLRGDVKTNVVDEISGLGQYINAYQSGTIVVYPMKMGDESVSAVRKRPTQALVMRVEEDKALLWIDRRHLKHYFGEKQLSFDKTKKELLSSGVLVNSDARKMLGAGTTEFRSSQIPCWLVDLKAAGLTGIIIEGGE